MTDSRFIDGALVQWGERLFFPNNRRVSQTSTPRLSTPTIGARAAAIRARIESTIRRAPQVMIKVTGGGRGMAAIAAHMRYISRNGRLPMENDQGAEREGKEAMRDIVDQWRLGGSHIPERSERREAFNIMLSMPRGTDPLIVGAERGGVEVWATRRLLGKNSRSPHCTSAPSMNRESVMARLLGGR